MCSECGMYVPHIISYKKIDSRFNFKIQIGSIIYKFYMNFYKALLQQKPQFVGNGPCPKTGFKDEHFKW